MNEGKEKYERVYYRWEEGIENNVRSKKRKKSEGKNIEEKREERE